MNPKEKKKLYEDIEKKTGVLSTPTQVQEFGRLVAGGFPAKLFDQWLEDCNLFYGDIRWAKVWSDHLKAQAYDLLINSSVQKSEPVENEKDENENIPVTGDGTVIENG